MTKTSLPVIDLAPYTERSEDDSGDLDIQARKVVAESLVQALHTVGFVYIKNHGVSQTEVNEAFRWSARFFELPMEDKMKSPHPPGWAVHRGYSWPGLEKVSNATVERDSSTEMAKVLREAEDFKESYEIGSEEFADMPNIWPPDHIIPGWQSFMSAFYWKCFQVCRTVLLAVTEGLRIPNREALLGPHSGVNGQLRLLHYPEVPADDILEGKCARMPAHTDWSTLTILFQDGCGGLQVEDLRQPGTFIDVTPIEGTLVLNIGDLLMRWSNDYLKSTQHRVTAPPRQGRSGREQCLARKRYSIPFFLAPDPDVVIDCLDLGQDRRPKYEPITQREYAAMRASAQY